jgi:hypothetical protein
MVGVDGGVDGKWGVVEKVCEVVSHNADWGLVDRGRIVPK